MATGTRADNCTGTPNSIPPATTNWFTMCLEGMHIVHIGLPVFDKASVIRGDHPRAVVAPLHAAHRTVMTLGRKNQKKKRQLGFHLGG